MTNNAPTEEIKSPHEAAEYFAWICGKDEQIEPLAAAFEARDAWWRSQVERERARREALDKELAGKEAEIKLLEYTFAHIHQAQYTTVGDQDILMDACDACGLDIRNSIHVRALKK